jgi:hypothetical protein
MPPGRMAYACSYLAATNPHAAEKPKLLETLN